MLALFVVLSFGAEPEKLFDGKSLAGWVVEGAKTFKDAGTDSPIWVADNGLLRCMVKSGSFGFLRHEKKVTDFHLHLEYRFEPNPKRRGNSGVGIRTVPFDSRKSVESRPSYAAYEIQLLDDAGKKPDRHSTGSLYRYVAPSEQAAKASPEWNALDVECQGPNIRIHVNGKKIIDIDQTKISALKGKPLEGYICLQNHGSRIDFRNITLRPLTSK